MNQVSTKSFQLTKHRCNVNCTNMRDVHDRPHLRINLGTMNLLIITLILILCNGVCVKAILDEVPQLKPVEKIKEIANIDDYLDSVNLNLSEDGLLDFKGLVRKYLPSHSIKEYDVFTEDGYILKLFHILGDKDKTVLLSHGLLESSDDFMVRGKTSLIYMLAKEDYDIWVMNYRGNRYSRKHTTLIPDKDPIFWNYSMQEFGYYDLAAVINFIYENNDSRALSIVGHSEGCAAVFILLSQKPEYNSKINVFIAMAPGCYIANSGPFLKTLVELGKVLGDILAAFGIHEVLGHNSASSKINTLLCTQGYAGYKLCVDGIFGSISGYEDGNIEQKFLKTLLGHFTAGTSRKNLVHYVQIGQSDRFADYDYGELNQVKYGSDLPPEYDLGQVTCKVELIAARNDQTITIKDVKRLIDMLPNNVSYHEVSFDEFTHFDYVWGKNAYKVLYPHVIKVLNKYS